MSLANDANLLLIPSGYKAGKVYSQFPPSGDGDFTFSRTGEATRINQAGVIETVASDVPRLDYSSGKCPDLLLEPQRTNLYLNSGELSTQNVTTSANKYTVSFYGTGTITFSGSYSGSLVGLSNLERVSITFTATSGTLISTVSGSVLNAQIEQGDYSTSYIPTTGSAVTRLADNCSGAGNATLFNDNEGVLFLETKGFVDAPAISTYIQLSKSGESSFTNSLVIQHRNNGALRIYVNGSASTDLHFNIDIDFAQNHKIAVLYKLNGYKLFIDGVAQSLFGTPTQTVFSGLDDLSFDLRGSSNWNAKIKDLRYYNTELTDAELQELTTL